MLADLRVIAVSRFAPFADLEEQDYVDLAAMAGRLRWVKRGEFVYHEQDEPSFWLLLRGWTANGIALPDGRRQLLKVQLPGDMLGLPNLALTRTADSAIALTDAQLGAIDPVALGRTFSHNPRLAALLYLLAQQERVAGMDRLVSVGATNALSRVAALLCDVHRRLQLADPTVGDIVDLPLPQSDLADLLGMTAVHLNRTIAQLRTQRIVNWRRTSVTIIDMDRLTKLALLPQRQTQRDATWLPASASHEAAYGSAQENSSIASSPIRSRGV